MMKKEKEHKPYSKKKYLTIILVGVFGLLLSFALLIIGAIMQSNEVDSKIYLPFCLSFLPICIIDVIFLIYHYPGLSLYEVNKQMEKTTNKGCQKIDNVNINIETYLNNNKFTLLDGGYYVKRKISFTKDFVNLYIKKCESDNIKETIDKEFEKFDSYEFKRRNKCFIMLIQKEGINEEDLNELMEVMSVFVSLETIPHAINDTTVIVLYDTFRNCAFCVQPGNKISFYNIGYKFVKKMLNVKK